MSRPKIVVKEVETPEELDAIFQLRYQVYCYETKSLDPKDYPDKREIDEYDKYSIHFIALAGDETIGTIRLIKPNAEGKFLMEEKIQLPSWLDRDKTLEGSRLVVKKEWRRYLISLFLLKEAFSWSREHGVIYWCSAWHHRFWLFLKKNGWHFINLKRGGPVLYHNTEVVPIILPIQDENVNFSLINEK